MTHAKVAVDDQPPHAANRLVSPTISSHCRSAAAALHCTRNAAKQIEANSVMSPSPFLTDPTPLICISEKDKPARRRSGDRERETGRIANYASWHSCFWLGISIPRRWSAAETAPRALARALGDYKLIHLVGGHERPRSSPSLPDSSCSCPPSTPSPLPPPLTPPTLTSRSSFMHRAKKALRVGLTRQRNSGRYSSERELSEPRYAVPISSLRSQAERGSERERSGHRVLRCNGVV